MPRISATSISVAPLRHSRSAMRAKSGLYGEGRPAGMDAADNGLPRAIESRCCGGGPHCRPARVTKFARAAAAWKAHRTRHARDDALAPRVNFVTCRTRYALPGDRLSKLSPKLLFR